MLNIVHIIPERRGNITLNITAVKNGEIEEEKQMNAHRREEERAGSMN